MRQVTAGPAKEKPRGNGASEERLGTTYSMNSNFHDDSASTFLTHDLATIAGAREAIRRRLVALTPAGRAAVLAAVDEAFSSCNPGGTREGFRRLSRSDARLEAWSVPLGAFVLDALRFLGVPAVLANEGVFLLDGRYVVHDRDELGRDLESGYSCIRLAGSDGIARAENLRAPTVVVCPNGRVVFHRKAFDKPEPVSLAKLLDRAAEVAV